MAKKKKGTGFYLTWLSLLLAAASLLSYLRNCRTSYFASFGVEVRIVILICAGIAVQILLLAAGSRIFRTSEDLITAAVPAVYTGALLLFVSARVNEMAAIFTFENNASNMADLSSAIAGMALLLLAVIFSLISAWFDIRKEAGHE